MLCSTANTAFTVLHLHGMVVISLGLGVGGHLPEKVLVVLLGRRGSSPSTGVASTSPAVFSESADGMSDGMSKDCKKNFTNPLHFVSDGSNIPRRWGWSDHWTTQP